jgi:hypothetical protein
MSSKGSSLGNRALRPKAALHFLRVGHTDRVSWRHRFPVDARGRFPRDRHPGRYRHLARNRPQDAGDGAAVTNYSQYSISSNVNGIEDIEAQTLTGISVQKIYFQPDVNLDLAIAQIVSATNAIRALLPPELGHPQRTAAL